MSQQGDAATDSAQAPRPLVRPAGVRVRDVPRRAIVPWRAGLVVCGEQHGERVSVPSLFKCMRPKGHTGTHRALVRWLTGGWTDVRWGGVLHNLQMITTHESVGDISLKG